MMLAGILVSLVIAFSAAIGFLPALGLDRPKRAAVLLACSIPILLAPLVVPRQAPFLRFVAAVCSLLILIKVYDLHLDARRASRIGWRPLLAFLPNWGSMVLRKLDSAPRPARHDNVVRLATGVLGLGIGTAILFGLFRLDWSAQPFAVEHTAKVVGLFCALIPAGVTAGALWRLAGARTVEWFDAPFASRTPADFWRRYNRPVGQFFFEDVFKRVGGVRTPARATLITFAVSGLVHEYVFDVASGRVQGYQLIFFLIQGCAVAATQRVKPRGLAAVPWVMGTFAFNLASSVIFFASVNEVVPFYFRHG